MPPTPDDTDAWSAHTHHREIRPDLGTLSGRGEAMWKSLFVTTGDVLVFMDADLLDWDTHVVPGLVGPLLTDPRIALVKGFYERPLTDGAEDGWVLLRQFQPVGGEVVPVLRSVPVQERPPAHRFLAETADA